VKGVSVAEYLGHAQVWSGGPHSLSSVTGSHQVGMNSHSCNRGFHDLLASLISGHSQVGELERQEHSLAELLLD
jgi:hypothetical protein